MTGERKQIFSERVSAGKRTYFFDVRESEKGTKYLMISVTRLAENGSRERQRLMLFQNTVPGFVGTLNKALELMKDA